MNSFEVHKCWPFDPVPDEEEMERERRDKYPFGNYDKIFIKVEGVKVDDIENWSRDPPPRHFSFLEEEEKRRQRERQRRMAGMPCASTEDLAGVRTDKGYLISLNDHLISLFRVEGKVYAVQDSCPHAGGPLSLGDIEDLPGGGLCVTCPWHKWKIQLKDGNVREPFGRGEKAVVYPVNITTQGDIYIGFDSLSDKFFNLDLHPSVDPCPKSPTPPSTPQQEDSKESDAATEPMFAYERARLVTMYQLLLSSLRGGGQGCAGCSLFESLERRE
ncbi:uncharacterized protein LOC143286378 [Babylonia areolata]|uniref:uncharacterized protein LOC143286378 n=1 Tax=Babylonia areolata TaxID=304850 RepID=UPI003FD356EB